MAKVRPAHIGEQLFLPFDAPQELLEPREIYALADDELLALIREDRRFERKSAGVHAAALADYLTMWANTSPHGGLIAVGVENDGTLSGCLGQSQDHMNSLERAGDIHCPDARYESRRVPIVNAEGAEDYVLLILCHYRHDRVVRNTKGKAFARRGESKKTLSAEEIRELEIDKGQVDFEQEPCRASFPGEFNAALVEQFRASFVSSRGLESDRSAEEVLSLRHLGVREGSAFRPNNACLLLFGTDSRSEFPGARIRFMRFDGEEEGSGATYNLIKDVWIEGPVPEVIRQSEVVVGGQLRDFSRLGRDGKFYTAPEYPRDAWHEAIVNACAHRSYALRSMYVQVKMFDDRLEVTSPGGFPPLVTAENIFSTQHSRNPHLMDALYYLDFVKMANEGVRRIRDTMEGSGLPLPEFSELHGGNSSVRVVLRNNIKQRKVWLDADASGLVGEAVFSTLSQDEKRIVNFVAENGRINVSQAHRLTSVAVWHSTRKILDQLVSRGILVRVARTDIERDPKAHFRFPES